MEQQELLNRIRHAISVYHFHNPQESFLVQCWLPEDFDAQGGCILRTRNYPLMMVGNSGDEFLAYRKVCEDRELRLCGLPARVPDESKGVVGRCFLSGAVSHAVPGLWTAFGAVQRREFSPNLHHYLPVEFPQLASTTQCGVKAMFVVRPCPPIHEAYGPSYPLVLPGAPGGEQPPVCRGVVEVVYRDARWSVVRELNQMVRSLDHIGLYSVNADPLCFDPNLQFPSPQLVDGVQQLMTALQEECKTLLCRVWTKVTARRNGLLSTKLTTERMPFAFTGRDVENFHLSCCGTMLELDEGPPGLALTSGKQYGLVPDCSDVHVCKYQLAMLARAAKLRGACAFVLSLTNAAALPSKTVQLCILEVFLRREVQPAASPGGRANPPRTAPQLAEMGRIASAARSIIAQLKLPLELPDIPQQPARNATASYPVMPTNGTAQPPPVLQEGQLPSSDPSAQNQPLVYRKPGTGGERIMALDVLERHFSFSLKEAALRIGVCPTTLKRICRQYGIKRWPSRKLNRAGGALAVAALQPAAEPGSKMSAKANGNGTDATSTSGTLPVLNSHREAMTMDTDHSAMSISAQGLKLDGVKMGAQGLKLDGVKMGWGSPPLGIEPSVPFDLNGGTVGMSFQPPDRSAATSSLDAHFDGPADNSIAIGGDVSELFASASGVLGETADVDMAGRASELEGLGTVGGLDDVWARGFDTQPFEYAALTDPLHVGGPLATSVAMDEMRNNGNGSSDVRLPRHARTHSLHDFGPLHLTDPNGIGGSLPGWANGRRPASRHLDDPNAIGGSLPGGMMINPSAVHTNISRLQHHAGGSLPGVSMNSTPLWADQPTSELTSDFNMTLVETEGSGISNINTLDWNLGLSIPAASSSLTNEPPGALALPSVNAASFKFDAEMLQEINSVRRVQRC